ILNYNLPTEDLTVTVPIGVSYKSDLEKVERITLEVAKELMQSHPEGVPDFEPLLRYQGFGDFSINFVVILKAKNVTGRFPLVHDFIKKLYERYKKEGIEIPFPIRKVYLSQEKN
ncbi:MAG: mechanosensitive ion channel family protein, partial [Caldimicrobium sp.]